MKKLISASLLLLLTMPVFGQITVKINNKPLKEALQIVEQNSNYSFFYSNPLPGKDALVSVDVKDKGIETVLSAMFKGLGIDYEISPDNQILLTAKPVQESAVPEKKEIKVTGCVTDESGQPVIGAAVTVAGTHNGTVTDLDGRYSITVPGPQTELEFSSLSMKTQRHTVGGRGVIDVVMQDDTQVLDAVVLVGYGTQKKVNLTGSVAMIGSEDLTTRPITNVASGLQGMLPGVTVTNPSGQPGNDRTTIRVRGVGTIGNSNPLILIDGVEGDLSTLNPEDIENISVLRDAASASIYGARGANGVLLVSTRRLNSGAGMLPTISFGAYVGAQTPTRLPKMCNAIEFMTLDNEARANVGTPAAWLDEHFDKVRNNTAPNYFADTDWLGEVLNKYALQQNYNLSVNGNMGGSGYMLSYRYLDQDGLTSGRSTGEQRHNLRFKLDSRLLKIVTLSSNVSYMNRSVMSPVNSLTTGGGAIYNAMRIAPNAPVRYTDGSWAYGGGNTNPAAVLKDGGHISTKGEEVSVSEVLKLDIIKGLSVSATYNLTSGNSFVENLHKTISFVNPETGVLVYQAGNPNSLKNSDAHSMQQTFILQSNFDFSFGKNNISGVVGMSQEWYKYRYLEASRNTLITEKNPTLNLGDATTMSNDARTSSWAIRSGFGRLCYNYAERYLLEVNLRYDLSSRFSKQHRGGLFPSVSGAWRLSEEPFMEFSRKIFDNIKIRASWGKLGNQYVGSSDYPYLSVLNSYSSDLSLIGGSATTGYTQSILANPNLSWEKITMTDVGLDIAMLGNRLGFTFDWYNKDTRGILLKRNYPAQIGATPSEENAGSVKNTGWEIDLSWRDNIGDFNYGISFNLSDVKNRITSLAGNQPDLSGDQIRRVGDPIDAFYGYVAEGLMTPDDFDIYDSATNTYDIPNIPVVLGYNYEPGDIKYKDISGPSGKPDGRITPEYDKVVIGSNIPRYTYCFNINMAYFGFDFNITMQGVGKCDGFLTGTARHAFQDMAAYPQKIHLKRYNIVSNPDPNASYPRLTYNTGFNQNTFSTYWLENAAYFRIKNVQLGYTLPEKLTTKAHISKCRIYFSGDNLLTQSKFFYAYDPETPVSKGGYYPQVRTFVVGLNLTFK